MSALRVPLRMPLLRPAGAGPRLTRWRADPDLAHLALPARPPRALRADELHHLLADLREAGYRGVVTAALPSSDQPVFHAAGFHVVERLHLLRLELRNRVEPGPSPTRRARRRDRDAILAVDRASFAPFWQLDGVMLTEAAAATHTARWRLVEDGAGQVAGYAICGRSGHHGYVQRLAVHPAHQGRGLGRSLLTDGLAWLKRRGARDALVNTQFGNRRSLRLYQRAGFVLQPTGLAVLRLDFDPHRPDAAPRSSLGLASPR